MLRFVLSLLLLVGGSLSLGACEIPRTNRPAEVLAEGDTEQGVSSDASANEPSPPEERTPETSLETTAESVSPDASPQDTGRPEATPDDLAPEHEPSLPDASSPEAASDTSEVLPEKTSPDPASPVSSLHLYDDERGSYLAPLQGTLDLRTYASARWLNLALKTNAQVGSVAFTYDSDPQRVENTAVFTAFAAGQDHRSKLSAGPHVLRAVLYSGPRLTGSVLERLEARFSILDTSPSNPPPVIPTDPTIVPADPTFPITKNVNQTIVISQPGVYDFKHILHIWTGSGSCNQTENQPHILRISASNVTVKNFAYKNAPDGIHIATCGTGQGNTCTGSISNILLDGITGWACEDALTTGKGTSKITIQNSFFLGNPNAQYRDKIMQLNFADDLLIFNTVFKNSPRQIRFKADARITLRKNRFYSFTQAVRGDTYADITGIPANVASIVTAENNHFQDGDRAYSVLGKVTVNSSQDTFRNVKTPKEEIDGAKVHLR